eukprot:6195220-Pleurochrysis_carterae.AAC.2
MLNPSGALIPKLICMLLDVALNVLARLFSRSKGGADLSQGKCVSTLYVAHACLLLATLTSMLLASAIEFGFLACEGTAEGAKLFFGRTALSAQHGKL